MEYFALQFENHRVPFSSKDERSTKHDTHVQTMIFSQKSCKQEEFHWARKTEFNELVVYFMHEENFQNKMKSLMIFTVRLKMEEMVIKSYTCKLIKCWFKYRKL